MKKKGFDVSLTFVGVLAALAGALLFFALAPYAAFDFARVYPGVAYLAWPGLLYTWAVAVLYALSLARFFRLTRLIARDNSFSLESAAHLKAISLYTLLATLWFLAGFIALSVLKVMSAGFALAFALAILFALVVSLLSRALASLTARAAKIKQENDLTV